MAGLVKSTQTQTGISGGPPGNNTTETDTSYVDSNGNGVKRGFVPAYGGMGGVPWYETNANVDSVSQVSLSTTKADSILHIYSHTAAFGWLASEDPTYAGTFVELSAAAVRAVRAYYDSGISAADANGFTWRARTAMFPGEPFITVVRFDMVNAGPVTTSPTDSYEFTLLSGLTQALQNGISAWQLADSGYGFVGGAQTLPVPGGPTAVEPDYLFIKPHAGSGVSTGIVSVKRQSVSAFTGSTNVQLLTALNANRLKIYLTGDNAGATGAATRTWYQLQAFRRGLTNAEAASIAADYVTPDAGTIVSVGTPAGTFADPDEACYVLAVNGGNAAALTHTIAGNVTKRWLCAYKLTSYTSSQPPAVTLGGSGLAAGVDYVSAVDTSAQVAYVKLLKGLVASGAGATELNNGLLAFAPASSVAPTDISGKFASSGIGFGGMNA